MHISWLGQTCIKLQTKNQDEDVTIIINPYKPEKGNFPRSLAPQIGLYTNRQKGSITLSQNPFIVDTLGELEVKKIMVYALPGPDEIIFKLGTEDMNIVFLGGISKSIDGKVLEKIGTPDILFVPVGGKPYLEAKEAADLVTSMEPKIIIPIGYKCDTDPSVKPLELFLKEIGLKPETTDKKVIIKLKDLPTEETRLIILDKNI